MNICINRNIRIENFCKMSRFTIADGTYNIHVYSLNYLWEWTGSQGNSIRLSNIQQQQQPFNGHLSGTTRVGRYQKKHSPAHTRSTYFLYHLSPFAMVHGILFIQLTCLTVLSNNLFTGPLWSSPWSWTLNFILHAFLHPIIIIFSQHMPMQTVKLGCNQVLQLLLLAPDAS